MENQLEVIDQKPAKSKSNVHDQDSNTTPPVDSRDIPYNGARYEPGYCASSNEWECPYPKCGFKLPKLKALNAHRKERHDCCLVCDLDFPSWDAYHDHKLLSSDHIVCPVCSQDFRSLDGRNRHIKLASHYPSESYNFGLLTWTRPTQKGRT